MESSRAAVGAQSVGEPQMSPAAVTTGSLDDGGGGGGGVEHADVAPPTVARVEWFPAASYASTPKV
jgi:hypothetical protein